MERRRRWFGGAAVDVGLVVWGVGWDEGGCEDWGCGGFVLGGLGGMRCSAGKRDRSVGYWEPYDYETWL